MGQAYEKRIRRAQEVQAATGRTPERTEPRSRQDIEKFIRGFGISAAAQRRIVDEWVADAERHRDAGWESHADSAWYDQG